MDRFTLEQQEQFGRRDTRHDVRRDAQYDLRQDRERDNPGEEHHAKKESAWGAAASGRG